VNTLDVVTFGEVMAMFVAEAADRPGPDPALAGSEVTAAVAPHADWIEVGTSLVKRYGVDGIAAIVAAAAGTPALADPKTADDAAYELTLAYDAGAASGTVLGLAADATLATAMRVAEKRGCELVVDLMELSPERRAALAGWLPGHVVLAAHVGKDAQASARRPVGLLGPWADGRRVGARRRAHRDRPSRARGPARPSRDHRFGRDEGRRPRGRRAGAARGRPTRRGERMNNVIDTVLQEMAVKLAAVSREQVRALADRLDAAPRVFDTGRGGRGSWRRRSRCG
jgi:3-hexulose-6-phosphate synthase